MAQALAVLRREATCELNFEAITASNTLFVDLTEHCGAAQRVVGRQELRPNIGAISLIPSVDSRPSACGISRFL